VLFLVGDHVLRQLPSACARCVDGLHLPDHFLAYLRQLRYSVHASTDILHVALLRERVMFGRQLPAESVLRSRHFHPESDQPRDGLHPKLPLTLLTMAVRAQQLVAIMTWSLFI